MSKITRGIRNCNPGNIRHGDNWDGLHPYSRHLDKSFCVFISDKFGIRALTKILIRYGKLEFNTVEKIINRYAPSNENDSESYIRSVCQRMGVDKNKVLNLNDSAVLLPLIKAIIHHENGNCPYSDEIIKLGITMAGVV